MTVAVTYSLRDGRLRAGGQVIQIRPLAFDILVVLLSARGGCVSLNDLIYRVWEGSGRAEPDSAPSIAGKHLHELRYRLRGTNISIETEWTRGYRAVIGDREVRAA